MSTTKELESTSVKAEKETDLGRLVAGMQDTLKGEKINSSSITFGFHAGTAKTEHNGEMKEITIVGLNAGVALEYKGRTFYTDIKKILAHAVENGLLDETIDFQSAE